MRAIDNWLSHLDHAGDWESVSIHAPNCGPWVAAYLTGVLQNIEINVKSVSEAKVTDEYFILRGHKAFAQIVAQYLRRLKRELQGIYADQR